MLIVAAALICALPAAAEFQLDVKEFELDNGLKILLLENHAAPLATYYTFYKVGARNERPGITGISHFHEHMMFNGAKKYGPKMFDLMLESNGGYSNAWTSKDMTAYYEVFSSDILELIVDLEADRMSSLAFEPEMVESEKGVVSEERLVSTDNSNGGIIYEELFAAAYMAHSYSWPVLGWMTDIKNFSREACVEYFNTYYAPNNATLVIVGDIDAEKALELVERELGGLKAGPPPAEVVRNEPTQRGPRRVMIEKPAQFSHLMRGYHVGDKDSPDLFALEIIQNLLTTGESCRLHQTLVNDMEIALGLWGGFSWGFDPSLFHFYVACVPGIDYDQVEQAFDSTMADFITEGPSAEEMERAQNSLVADFYKSFKTNNGTAGKLGRYQTLYGDWRLMYQFPEMIKAVTADQVKEAAAKYFTSKNSTTAVLIPEGGAL
ncbi:MAG: insulinase family protein [FCB group bacterium]|nr:insulinase family protein [FCB group bacterium]